MCLNFRSEVTQSVTHSHEQLPTSWCLWAVLQAMMSSMAAKREETSKVAGDSKLSIMRDCGLPGACTGSHIHNSTVLQITNVFLTCSKSVAVPF